MGIRERISSLFRGKPAGSQAAPRSAPSRDDEFAVIGLGVFGRNLALRLSQLGFTVLGVDSDGLVVRALADDLSAALVLDATDEEALREADLESYRTAIVAIGGDHFEATALTTIALAKIGIPRIIALASTRRQVEILQAIGATRVLNPVEESAVTLADELTDPGRGDTWSLSPGHQVALVPVPTTLVGRTAEDCERLGARILLVARGEDATLHPEPSFALQSDDILLVEGSPVELLNFRRMD
jgi:trk system potassium uptake protein TrkA